MITLGQLLDEIANARTKLLHFRNSTVKKQVQIDLHRVAEAWPWVSLRATKSVTMDNNGVVMPSNMAGNMIFAVDDDDTIYYPRDSSRISTPTGPYATWYISAYSTEALTSGNGFSATKGSTSITLSADGTADEYIRFGNVNDIFKIVSVGDDAKNIVIDHAWREPSVSSSANRLWEIRPAGTKTITFLDEDGDALTSSGTTMTIAYGTLPRQVYEDTDIILVPDEVLKHKVESVVSNGATERERAANKYQEALLKAISANPDPFVSYSYPRDKHGSLFAIDTHIWKSR